MSEEEENIICLCDDCSKTMYPNKGKFDIKTGQFVKLEFTDGKHTEYMWVKITNADIPLNEYEGKLNNKPVFLKNIKLGDKVKFKKEEVYDASK